MVVLYQRQYLATNRSLLFSIARLQNTNQTKYFQAWDLQINENWHYDGDVDGGVDVSDDSDDDDYDDNNHDDDNYDDDMSKYDDNTNNHQKHNHSNYSFHAMSYHRIYEYLL